MDVTQVQCTTKNVNLASACTITAARISSPKILRCAGLAFFGVEEPDVTISVRSSATDVPDAEGAVDLSFFDLSTLSPSDTAPLGRCMCQRATAADTHTIGVSVSISCTITPAK
jgi:hypothetical protein